MAALIRQANSGYELANKLEIKTKDVWWKRREGKQNSDNNSKQTLSEKKEEAGNVSEQRDKGWIYADGVCVCVKRQTLTRLPPHSCIVNERYNLRNKMASKEKKQSLARTGY